MSENYHNFNFLPIKFILAEKWIPSSYNPDKVGLSQVINGVLKSTITSLSFTPILFLFYIFIAPDTPIFLNTVLRPMIRKMFDWNQDLVWFLCHLTSFVDVFFFTFINYIVFYIILFFVALSLIHFGK